MLNILSISVQGLLLAFTVSLVVPDRGFKESFEGRTIIKNVLNLLSYKIDKWKKIRLAAKCYHQQAETASLDG